MEPRPGDDGDLSLPDSGMDTGSDAGEPGPRLGPGDLRPDEERLLAALERDAAARRDSEDPQNEAEGENADDDEEQQAIARAAADETPLPGEGGAPDDGLTPRFSDSG